MKGHEKCILTCIYIFLTVQFLKSSLKKIKVNVILKEKCNTTLNSRAKGKKKNPSENNEDVKT